MTGFDLVIRGGTVVTAADTFCADVGIAGGKSRPPRRNCPWARLRSMRPESCFSLAASTATATSSSCRRPVWSAPTTSVQARCPPFGGTTTIIPSAAQHRGQSLRKVVQDYQALAGPKAVVDYSFHLIVSEPNEQVLSKELPALIEDGYTSFKVYITYNTLKLEHRQMLDVLSVARRHGAMVMVHAENKR